MSERVQAPFAPLMEALPESSRTPPVHIGRARVTTWTSDDISLQLGRHIALGIALFVISGVTIGGAQFLRAREETELLSHGLLLVSIPLVLVAWRALFSTPRFLLTAQDVRTSAIRSPFVRETVLAFSDVADVRVRLLFERYKDVMRVVSARLVVVARDGRTLFGPATETLPVDTWKDARDAILPLAREIARRAHVPLVIEHEGPLPPALRDAESPLSAREYAGDDDDDDDDDDDANEAVSSR